MKKVLLLALIAAFTACSSTENAETKEEGYPVFSSEEPVRSVAYACPMRCEGEKTYAEEGKCPVCEMELKEIAMADAEADTDSTHAGHDH
jgi:Cu2+-exporting ATPase